MLPEKEIHTQNSAGVDFLEKLRAINKQLLGGQLGNVTRNIQKVASKRLDDIPELASAAAAGLGQLGKVTLNVNVQTNLMYTVLGIFYYCVFVDSTSNIFL